MALVFWSCWISVLIMSKDVAFARMIVTPLMWKCVVVEPEIGCSIYTLAFARLIRLSVLCTFSISWSINFFFFFVPLFKSQSN